MSGVRIKQYREKNKYSQKDLANILGVSVRTIVRWEQNNSKPNGEELKRIVTLIGVTENELLNEEDDIESLSSTNPNQTYLERISDGVDNLVSGQESINNTLISGREEYHEKQEELIQELRKQNSDLMKKLEDNSAAYDLQKEMLRQRKIRNLIIFGFVVLLLVIIAISIWYLFNFGPITADQPEIIPTK